MSELKKRETMKRKEITALHKELDKRQTYLDNLDRQLIRNEKEI